MEKIVVNYNQAHFKNACSSKKHNQDFYELLTNNEIRENIFIRTLDENDCDDEDVRNFINLLQAKYSSSRTHHTPLTELEWEMIVKAKKTAHYPYFSTEAM